MTPREAFAAHAGPAPGVARVAFHTIVWQYLRSGDRARVRAAIEAAGTRAAPDTPLAWLAMEADGGSDGAALTLRLWPGDGRHRLGRADFHGRWVHWTAPRLTDDPDHGDTR